VLEKERFIAVRLIEWNRQYFDRFEEKDKVEEVEWLLEEEQFVDEDQVKWQE